MRRTKHSGTVLVTGAGRRLGRAIALDLANQGWRVGVHFHTARAEALDVVTEIEAGGGQAIALCANLADLDTLTPLISACAEALGQPTCLINNAAQFDWDNLQELNGKSWSTHLDVNLRAPVFLTQAFAKVLPETVNGNVVNIIDQKILAPDPEYFSYTIAKSALWTATRLMAQALAPKVRVNAVAPGPVMKSQDQSEAAFEREVAATLLQQRVAPEDVTEAVRFLLETPSITGQMIAVDSGQHLAPRNPAIMR